MQTQTEPFIWELAGLTIWTYRDLPWKEKVKLIRRYKGIAISEQCSECGSVIAWKKAAKKPLGGSWLVTRFIEHMSSHYRQNERKCNCQQFGSTVW